MQIPSTAKEVRFKIMRNIGLSFVRMGQYQDALQSFNTVMENVPDHQTGYNQVICAYALGNVEGMRQVCSRGTREEGCEGHKHPTSISWGGEGLDPESPTPHLRSQAFLALLDVPGFEDDKVEEDLDEDEDEDVVQDDGLRDELKKRHNYIARWAEGLFCHRLPCVMNCPRGGET